MGTATTCAVRAAASRAVTPAAQGPGELPESSSWPVVHVDRRRARGVPLSPDCPNPVWEVIVLQLKMSEPWHELRLGTVVVLSSLECAVT